MGAINLHHRGSWVSICTLFSCWLVLVPADCVAMVPVEVIEAARAVSQGTASEYQKRLAFKYNKQLNLMAMQGDPQMPKEVYNEYQKWFEGKNQEFAQQAVTKANETMNVQKRKPGQTSKPGTDSDYLSSSRTPEKTKEILGNYEKAVDEWMNDPKAGGEVGRPEGKTWAQVTDTDIMGDARRSTPEDFKKIGEQQNDAYKRQGAAELERKLRDRYTAEEVEALKNDPKMAGKTLPEVGQMKDPPTLAEHQAYAEEMEQFVGKKSKKSDHLLDEIVELKKNPEAHTPGTEAYNKRMELEAELHRIHTQESKYLGRQQETTEILREQHGLAPGEALSKLPEEGSKRMAATADPEKRAAELEQQRQARNKAHAANAMEEHLRQQAVKARAEALGEIGAKDPDLRGQAQADIAKLAKDLPDSQKGEVIEQLRRQHGDKFAEEVAEQMRKVAAAGKAEPPITKDRPVGSAAAEGTAGEPPITKERPAGAAVAEAGEPPITKERPAGTAVAEAGTGEPPITKERPVGAAVAEAEAGARPGGVAESGAAEAGAKKGPARVNIAEIAEQARRNNPVVTPEQVGGMPGKLPPEQLPPRRVSGDPGLADLAEPGRQHIPDVKGDPDLAKLGRGESHPATAAEAAEPAITKERTGSKAAGGSVDEPAITKERPAVAEPPLSEPPSSSVLQRAKDALGKIQAADQAAAQKLGVGELPSSASGARKGLNVAAEKAGAALLAAGTAEAVGTPAYYSSKEAIFRDMAAQAQTPEERKMFLDAAQGANQMKEMAVQRGAEFAQDLAKWGAAGVLLPTGTAAAGALAMGYYGGRAVLENTETGKKIDKAAQDVLTDLAIAAEDKARRERGEDSIELQEYKAKDARQDAWLRALRRGDIQLQEGATVQDLLDMVDRMHEEGKITSLDNLGDMGNVVQKAPKAEGPSDRKPSLEEAFVQHADAPAGSGGQQVASLTPGSEQLTQEFARSALPGQERTSDPKAMLGGSTQEAQDVAVEAQKARDQQDAQNQTLLQTKRQQEAEWAQRWQQIQQHIEQVRQAEAQLAAQKLAGQQQQGQQATQSAQQGIEATQKAQQEFARQVAEIQGRIDEQKRILDREINAAIQARIAQGLGGAAGESGAQPGGGMAGSGGTTAINQCAHNLTWNGQMMTMACGCPGHTFNASKGMCEAQGGGGMVAGGQGGLGTGLPEPLDVRTVQCNVPTYHKSGSDAPAMITVPVGPNSGAVSFRYDTYTVPDQMTVSYGTQELFTTGCVGKAGTVQLQLPGGGHVTVNVKPNCANTKSTSWTFTVSCPVPSAVSGLPGAPR